MVKKLSLLTLLSTLIIAQAPVCAMEPEAEPVMQVIKANGAGIAAHLLQAVKNAAGYIPVESIKNGLVRTGKVIVGFLPGMAKQVTEEAKVFAEALTKTPMTTTVLVAAAGYGVYKLYKKVAPSNARPNNARR